MKNSIPLTLTRAGGALCLLMLATQLPAQTSAFTYQGALTQNGQPANGTYDFMFRLLDAETDGTAAPVIPVNPGVAVTNGLFTTGINFDAENLNGANLWLEISVRTNGGGAFTTLAPRQLLTSAPYAVRAANVSASAINGTYGNAVTFNNAANSFAGSGAELTALNATALTQGTVPPAALDNAWKIGGNTGTAAGTHFIGTLDDQPLELKVNNLRVIRLEPAADSSDQDSLLDGAANIVMGSAGNVVGASVVGATIGGGGATNYNGVSSVNTVHADYATTAGGLRNKIHSGAEFSSVGGGFNNEILANSFYSAISGGVGGKIGANARGAFIGGGTDNVVDEDLWGATIAGGYNNRIGTNSSHSTIGGGQFNHIESVGVHSATIAGGSLNRIEMQASEAFIGGGSENTIGVVAESASITGGGSNSIGAGSSYAFIGGGQANRVFADSRHAVVLGGFENSATNLALAAGYRANAGHTGSFVWADSIGIALESESADSVTFRATGGYRLFSNAAATAGVSLAPNATAWSVISDRAVKKDFVAVDSREVLEKLAAVPVQSWHYHWESADATPHLGPVAQDFKAAFYPGRDDQSITTLEFDGVALAAIQGLNQKLEARSQESEARSQLIERKLQEELHRRDAENTELRRQNGALLKRLEAIEARMR